MSNILQTYPWMQPSWTQLNRYISQNRIPQALLMTGNRGLGKLQLAEYFSQLIMCSFPTMEGEPCEKSAILNMNFLQPSSASDLRWFNPI